MTQLLTRTPLLRRAAQRVGGALGRFFSKIVVVSPAAYDLPAEDWPRFPPF